MIRIKVKKYSKKCPGYLGKGLWHSKGIQSVVWNINPPIKNYIPTYERWLNPRKYFHFCPIYQKMRVHQLSSHNEKVDAFFWKCNENENNFWNLAAFINSRLLGYFIVKSKIARISTISCNSIFDSPYWFFNQISLYHIPKNLHSSTLWELHVHGINLFLPLSV